MIFKGAYQDSTMIKSSLTWIFEITLMEKVCKANQLRAQAALFPIFETLKIPLGRQSGKFASTQVIFPFAKPHPLINWKKAGRDIKNRRSAQFLGIVFDLLKCKFWRDNFFRQRGRYRPSFFPLSTMTTRFFSIFFFILLCSAKRKFLIFVWPIKNLSDSSSMFFECDNTRQ